MILCDAQQGARFVGSSVGCTLTLNFEVALPALPV